MGDIILVTYSHHIDGSFFLSSVMVSKKGGIDMFTIEALWFLIPMYIIGLILWIVFRLKDGCLTWCLSFLGISSCLFSMIFVPGNIAEENVFLGIIAGLIMFGIFFATCTETFEKFFSIATFKIVLLVIGLFVLLGLFILAFYFKDKGGFLNLLISIICIITSVIGVMMILSELTERK